MKVIIDIDSDIIQKITNQYYGENEVNKTLINELLMSLMHGISLNVVLDKIRAEIEHWESDDTQDDYQIGAMDMQNYALRVIDKYR